VLVITVVAMLSGPLSPWHRHILGMRMEEGASKYGG